MPAAASVKPAPAASSRQKVVRGSPLAGKPSDRASFQLVRLTSGGVVRDSSLPPHSAVQYGLQRLRLLAVAIIAAIVSIALLHGQLQLVEGTAQAWRAPSGFLRAVLSTPLYLSVFAAVAPHILSGKRLMKAIAVLICVRAPLLVAIEATSPLHRSQKIGSLSFRIFRLLYDITLVATVFGLPAYVVSASRRAAAVLPAGSTPSRPPAARTQLQFRSRPMAVAVSIVVPSTILTSVLSSWTPIDLVQYSSGIMFFWMIALLRDKSARQRYIRCAWYGTMFAYINDMVGYGGSSTLTMITAISRSISVELAPLLAYIMFSVIFSGLRLLVSTTAVTYFGGQDGMLFLFPIQLLEDLLSELAFLGVTSFSSTFFAIVAVTVLRQLIRDTSLVEDTADRALRWLRSQPPAPLHVRRARFEMHSRILEQNVVSELVVAILLPLMLLADIYMPHGAASITAGMSRAVALDQVAVYSFLLVIEVAVHWFIHQFKLKQLRRLAPRDAADAYRLRKASSSAVSDGEGSGSQDVSVAAGRRGALDWSAASIESAYSKWTFHYIERHRYFLMLAAAFMTMDATAQLYGLQAPSVE
eukprot:PLAT171.3.p1 GENE.PLAT171.3~~PLAT171.3.p1  ORF type:complete len:585 (+),score=190.74 PLAT171.3:152-1906(+)